MVSISFGHDAIYATNRLSALLEPVHVISILASPTLQFVWPISSGHPAFHSPNGIDLVWTWYGSIENYS